MRRAPAGRRRVDKRRPRERRAAGALPRWPSSRAVMACSLVARCATPHSACRRTFATGRPGGLSQAPARGSAGRYPGLPLTRQSMSQPIANPSEILRRQVHGQARGSRPLGCAVHRQAPNEGRRPTPCRGVRRASRIQETAGHLANRGFGTPQATDCRASTGGRCPIQPPAMCRHRTAT